MRPLATAHPYCRIRRDGWRCSYCLQEGPVRDSRMGGCAKRLFGVIGHGLAARRTGGSSRYARQGIALKLKPADVVSDYRRDAMILTSNTPTNNWNEFFTGDDTLLCTLDRLFDRTSVNGNVFYRRKSLARQHRGALSFHGVWHNQPTDETSSAR